MRTKTSGPWTAVLFLLAIGVALLPAAAPAEEDNGKAETFLVSLGERAIVVARDSEASVEDRETRIRALLREGFDVPVIARLVLGKHWRKIDKDQRSDAGQPGRLGARLDRIGRGVIGHVSHQRTP